MFLFTFQMCQKKWGENTHTDEMWWKVRFFTLSALMSTSGCCQISLSGFVLFFFVCFSFDDFLRLFTCNKLITALATLIFSLLYKCETDDSWVFLLNLFRLMMFLLSFFVLLACKSLGFETSLWFYRSFRFLLNFRFSSIRHLLVTRMFPLLMLLFVFVWLI